VRGTLTAATSVQTEPVLLCDAETLQGKDKEWHELDTEERRAAETIGYTATAWSSGELPPLCAQPWAALRDQERAAAECLGYEGL